MTQYINQYKQYYKNGDTEVAQIIHRAMYHVDIGDPMWTNGPPAPHAGYITKGDNNIYIQGSKNVHIKGSQNIQIDTDDKTDITGNEVRNISGTQQITVTGAITIKASTINLNP